MTDLLSGPFISDAGGTMYDLGGDDTLNGGAGDDVLSGQSGNDTFVFNPTFGHDIITDFTAGGATDDGDG